MPTGHRTPSNALHAKPRRSRERARDFPSFPAALETGPETRRESGRAAGGERFYDEVVRTLRRLGPQRFKVSIFLVTLQGISGDCLYPALASALGRFGLVGPLPGRRLGLLYIGPREAGARGDAKLERDIRQRLHRVLREAGFDARAVRPAEVVATHFWLDELLHVDDLIVT